MRGRRGGGEGVGAEQSGHRGARAGKEQGKEQRRQHLLTRLASRGGRAAIEQSRGHEWPSTQLLHTQQLSKRRTLGYVRELNPLSPRGQRQQKKPNLGVGTHFFTIPVFEDARRNQFKAPYGFSSIASWNPSVHRQNIFKGGRCASTSRLSTRREGEVY